MSAQKILPIPKVRPLSTKSLPDQAQAVPHRGPHDSKTIRKSDSNSNQEACVLVQHDALFKQKRGHTHNPCTRAGLFDFVSCCVCVCPFTSGDQKDDNLAIDALMQRHLANSQSNICIQSNVKDRSSSAKCVRYNLELFDV